MNQKDNKLIFQQLKQTLVAALLCSEQWDDTELFKWNQHNH